MTPDAFETDLPDLREVALDALCRRAPQDVFAPFREVLNDQVDRPRFNIGSGPPGRAD
jgi:hypothetical protein